MPMVKAADAYAFAGCVNLERVTADGTHVAGRSVCKAAEL